MNLRTNSQRKIDIEPINVGGFVFVISRSEKRKFKTQLKERYENYLERYETLQLNDIFFEDFAKVDEINEQTAQFHDIQLIDDDIQDYPMKELYPQKFRQQISQNLHNKLNLIVHINFPFLMILNLRQLNISSIQGLAFLKAPCLESLHLDENHITLLKPLQKSSFPNLELLSLYMNSIVDWKWMNRAVFVQKFDVTIIEQPEAKNQIYRLQQLKRLKQQSTNRFYNDEDWVLHNQFNS